MIFRGYTSQKYINFRYTPSFLWGTCKKNADLIDAAWTAGVSYNIAGDTGSGNYTTYAWEIGVGKGLTVTPTRGDTTKKLFIPNIGRRLEGSGTASFHGEYAYLWSTNQYNVADAYRLFVSSYYSEVISVLSKGRAYSLRCVRS